MATIDHGLPATLYRFNQKGGSYLAFLGRIAPEKRPDRAIEIAKRAGIPLKIAAKVDPADQEYFEHVIEPLLHDPLVEFIGEIGDHGKSEFLGNALALLFPIDWPEPFGLVMIEAMATGTPVIGWGKGSVPKVIDEGVTGFVVDSIEGALRAVGQLGGLDRSTVRQQFEARFTVSQMTLKYLAVYEELIGAKRKKLVKSVPVAVSRPTVDDHPLQPLQVNGL
jgi:glycosyltransferase involved in cell wall biosynthesis